MAQSIINKSDIVGSEDLVERPELEAYVLKTDIIQNTPADSSAILTLRDKLIGNDAAVKVQGLLPTQTQEFTLLNFNGRTLIYYSAGWSHSDIIVADYNPETHTASNNHTAFVSADLGINSTIIKCNNAFVFNSKVYMVVSCWHDNYCAMLSSIDGINFTLISKTIVDSVSGFKIGLYGNHSIIPYKIDGYYYWFIEGTDLVGDWQWEMKLLRSTNMESGWESLGKIEGLATGGAYGGSNVFYDNGIFKMFYHYCPTLSLPSFLGYAEADANNPLYFTKIYYPLLEITRNIYPHIDQIADPEIVEVNGKTYMFAEYVDNSAPFADVYVWESNYRIQDILTSSIRDKNAI